MAAYVYVSKSTRGRRNDYFPGGSKVDFSMGYAKYISRREGGESDEILFW